MLGGTGLSQVQTDNQTVYGASPSIPIAIQRMGTGQSPIGMALGEFMAESDFDFLNNFSMPMDPTNNRMATYNMPPLG